MTPQQRATDGQGTGLDWPALIRAGLVGLRLTPDQFWRLTPAELRLMLGQDTGAVPLGRSGLDQLMQAFPDPAALTPKETGAVSDD
ncbi:phage tail assembly chaperone [Phaeobacter sp. LSS9]|uniref:rcc01693 family protein n=1 Tax=Phaeobacter sp. LSS9 TaxID=681157 RepID=UPI000E4FAD89|nr:rcc01693 family protein [Phaeobacter sp. LSS9]AXT34345.1 phage tail assembly chaperone [Phaeobacter sp. LSS9]